MLADFDPKLQTILETDAFDFVTAAIPSQYDKSGTLGPVAFMTKRMIPAECNYEIFDEQLPAIVHAFETWSSELGSVEVSTLILTDRKNLEQFTTTKKLNRRQARWNELLSEFEFKIVFRPGKQGGKPDALTRISSDRPLSIDDDRNRNRHQNQIMLKPHQILRSVSASVPDNIDNENQTQDPGISIDQWALHCAQDKYCQEI
ncbi:hypothetical protein K3495_g1088 [Podosphaera aphanis]|nr:hypothetical protein K3495_g1088 [Podosphaera aphanis]